MDLSPVSVPVLGVAVRGPGLPGWAESAAMLAGGAPWRAGELALGAPPLLPPNERRRASPAVRLALSVAGEAVAMAGLDPAGVRAVWGSGAGDGATVDGLLRALAAGEPVSPTQFHNSVHNAVAGYWAIGAGSRAGTVCLGGHRESWAAALLAAFAEAARADDAQAGPVLLCVYDVPMPDPLGAVFPIAFPFACALVLAGPGGHATAGPPGALARLRAGWSSATVPEPAEAAGLAGMPAGNPAARALPLLRALARREAASLAFGLDGGAVQVELVPC